MVLLVSARFADYLTHGRPKGSQTDYYKVGSAAINRVDIRRTANLVTVYHLHR